MITLRTDAKFDDLERLIDKISRPGNGQTRMIADGIRQQFQTNFTRQGSGAGSWAPLAPSTQVQRRAQGFAGNRPILVRRGDYRKSFVDRGGDNYESIQTTGFGLVIDVGSNDRRAPWLERGTSRMPARPVTLLDDGQENRLMDLLDFVVDQIERQFWR
jgi:phage gpG-like protein